MEKLEKKREKQREKTRQKRKNKISSTKNLETKPSLSSKHKLDLNIDPPCETVRYFHKKALKEGIQADRETIQDIVRKTTIKPLDDIGLEKRQQIRKEIIRDKNTVVPAELIKEVNIDRFPIYKYTPRQKRRCSDSPGVTYSTEKDRYKTTKYRSVNIKGKIKLFKTPHEKMNYWGYIYNETNDKQPISFVVWEKSKKYTLNLEDGDRLILKNASLQYHPQHGLSIAATNHTKIIPTTKKDFPQETKIDITQKQQQTYKKIAETIQKHTNQNTRQYQIYNQLLKNHNQ